MGTPILPPTGQPLPMREGEFKSASTPNDVSFEFKNVQPPSPLYVGRDDNLVLEVASSFSPLTVTFNARLLLANGNIVSIQQAFAYAAAVGVTLQQVLSIPEGYLLSVSAYDSNNNQRGMTFARCFMTRGKTTPLSPNASYVLFSDYTTQNHVIGWPGGRALYPTEGPGNLVQLSIANPGAGADWTVTIPTNVRIRVMSISALLTTAAAVANRVVRIQTLIGGVINYQGAAGANVVASTAAQVSAGQGIVGSSVDPTTVQISLPDNLYLLSQSGVAATIKSSTLLLQGADQWSNVVVLGEQWLDNGNA